MSVFQCGEYLNAYNNRHLEDAKQSAVLLDGLAQQIISGVGSMIDKRAKYITLQRLYPNLFANNNKDTDQTLAQAQDNAWLAFLFG